MASDEHYDTPWEFLARPTSVRLSNADVRLSQATLNESPSPSPSFVQQLVHIGNSAAGRRQHRTAAADDQLLETNVDRVEAEKRLESRQLGDYLLRSRGEGSAALSLRATKGVVHIKIEKSGDRWIIGEGPCFRSIQSAIHYYRRHPLPIRGADHLILKQHLKRVNHIN